MVLFDSETASLQFPWFVALYGILYREDCFEDVQIIYVVQSSRIGRGTLAMLVMTVAGAGSSGFWNVVIGRYCDDRVLQPMMMVLYHLHP